MGVHDLRSLPVSFVTGMLTYQFTVFKFIVL